MDESAGRPDGRKCFKCGFEGSGDSPVCADCGFNLNSVRLYDPDQFALSGFFLSAMVPIVMAAANYGQMGMAGARRRWLLGGIAGFLVVFSAIMILGERGGRVLLASFLLNAIPGWYLGIRQRGMVKSAFEAGAGSKSMMIGVLKGLGLGGLVVICGSVIMGGLFVYWTEKAGSLIGAGDCEGASTILERVHSTFGDLDDYTLYQLAWTRMCLKQWEASAEAYRSYISRLPDDPTGHAYLGYVLQELGQEEESRQEYDRAMEIDPGILEELFEREE